MKSRTKRTNLLDRENEIRNKHIKYINNDAEKMILTFRDNIKRINNRFEIIDLLYAQKKIEEANDILRYQIIYAMSALDFFMHEIYCFGLLKIFRNEKPRTYKYNEYKIPLKLLEQALYDAENIDYHLKETFIDLNRNFTFMSPGRIRELLNIISSEDEFAMAEKILKDKNIISDHDRLDHILDKIYDRRNKIAHQTDINHGNRDGNKNTISKGDVEESMNIISHLVETLYKIICLD